MPVPRLHIDRAALLVVDVQEKLLPHIHERERLVRQVVRLIDGAAALELPVVVTEQYRKGLGATAAEVVARLPQSATVHEKLKFSACIAPVREQLSARSAVCVLVCGIEAHVCVLQTCLDLLDAGYLPVLVTDAIGSRRAADRDVAVQRLVQAGVLPSTVESALLELVHEAGGARFKAVLPLIK
jgi:nicotinamidase-related amidase